MSSASSDLPPAAAWSALRERLQAKALLQGARASLSLRIAGGAAMWFGAAHDGSAQRMPLRSASATGDAALHGAIYAARPDAAAIAGGGGAWGACVADFGGALPAVFDEQARHLGRMPTPVHAWHELAAALRGGGNALLVCGSPVCLGTTATRLALNAELFEKCAKAWVLAAAAGGPIEPLPWLVRRVANARLLKDQRRAAQRLAAGLLPEESRGY